MLLQLVKSQTTTLNRVKRGLWRREIVAMLGHEPQGKTILSAYITGENSSGGRDRKSILPRPDRKEYELDVMEGVAITQLWDKITPEKLQRQILQYFGEAYGNDPLLVMNRRYNKLMLDLEAAKIMPVMVVDAVELMPVRGLRIIKKIAQWYYRGQHLGIAVLLSGNICKQKRDLADFWLHTTEVKVGRVLADEVRDLIGFVAPGYRRHFTEAALAKLAEIRSTAEMKKIIREAVSYWEERSDEKHIDAPIIRKAVAQIAHTTQLRKAA